MSGEIKTIFKEKKFHSFRSKSGNSYKEGCCKKNKIFQLEEVSESLCAYTSMNGCSQRKTICKETAFNLKKQVNKILNSEIFEPHLFYSFNL